MCRTDGFVEFFMTGSWRVGSFLERRFLVLTRQSKLDPSSDLAIAGFLRESRRSRGGLPAELRPPGRSVFRFSSDHI
jgi:hypothetical protein